METRDLNLPTSEQLEQFYYLRGLLQNTPKNASAEEKKAFCNLVLGVCPGAMDIKDIELVQKLCPEEWHKYCNWEWGTPEELRATEEERLLQQGWERGIDGEMYIRFP
jgi:hypothetical protein